MNPPAVRQQVEQGDAGELGFGFSCSRERKNPLRLTAITPPTPPELYFFFFSSFFSSLLIGTRE